VFIIGFLFSTLNGGLAIVYRYHWFSIWTHEEQVVELGASCMYIMWMFHVGDCLKTIGISIARSCGKFILTIIVNAICCIVIGYTTSYLLGIYFHYGIHGVWFGMACAWISCAFVYLIIILRIDWYQEAAEAEDRLNKGLSSMQNEN
jgi:MATE family multidrug resistance protein